MEDEMNCEFCKTFNFLKTIQKEKDEDGQHLSYEYTSAIVDQLLVDGDKRGKTIHYTWQVINYCPSCGKKLI